MPHDAQTAFFSYARADREFALRLANDLRLSGALVWIDQLDIRAGERWDSAVEYAVRNCSRMIVVLSPAAVASHNVMDEVSYALDANKIVIPLLYRDCMVPLRLNRIQYIDFRGDYSAGVKTVLSALTGSVEETGRVTMPEQTWNDEYARGAPKNATSGDFPVRPKEAATNARGIQSRRKYLLGGGGMGLALATAIGTWYVLPHEPPGDSYGTEKRVFKDWNKNELFEHFPTVIFGNHFFYRAVKPRIVIGRTFTEDEFSSKFEYGQMVLLKQMALLNQGFWQKYLRSDPSVLERMIYLNDRGFTVVGVVSIPGNWQDRADIWLPRPG
jgi:hypothetical protein